ncbi:MAG: hypothetical protein IJ679_11410 [Lachnospiraceae bacterium]|nr:hypothetical protein [Lachnospiraceae bacterium]
MTIEEIRNLEIDNFCRLQMIKRDNGDQENPTLDYQIKQSAAKLESMGVNLESLIIVE